MNVDVQFAARISNRDPCKPTGPHPMRRTVTGPMQVRLAYGCQQPHRPLAPLDGAPGRPFNALRQVEPAGSNQQARREPRFTHRSEGRCGRHPTAGPTSCASARPRLMSAGGSSMRRSMIVVLLVALAAVAGSASEVSEFYKYGNWCGDNHPADSSENPKPVDAIDEACRRHDLAYDTGKNHGEADAKLSRELVHLVNSGNLNGDQAANAVLMAVYMTGHQHLNVIRDDLPNGKVSSTVKVAISTGEAIVVLPPGVTAAVLDEVAHKLGGPGGKLINVVADGYRVPGRLAREVGNAGEKILNELSNGWGAIKSWSKSWF